MRSRNEDVFMLRPEFGFLAVADGMGGTSAGHIAARIAVDEVSDHLHEVSKNRDITSRDIVEAITSANLVSTSTRPNLTPTFQGMGTTLVSIVVNEYKATLGHVGDSRAYLLRKKKLSRMTRDHSVVQDLVDRGELKFGTSASGTQSQHCHSMHWSRTSILNRKSLCTNFNRAM